MSRRKEGTGPGSQPCHSLARQHAADKRLWPPRGMHRADQLAAFPLVSPGREGRGTASEVGPGRARGDWPPPREFHSLRVDLLTGLLCAILFK